MLTTSNIINLAENENDWSNNNGVIAGKCNDGVGSCISSSPTTPLNIQLIIDENNESGSNNNLFFASQQQTSKKKAINSSVISNSGSKLQFGKLIKILILKKKFQRFSL